MEPNNNEIDEGIGYVGYREALDLVSANVRPVGVEELSLDAGVGRNPAGAGGARLR
jgi:hypothetical protein